MIQIAIDARAAQIEHEGVPVQSFIDHSFALVLGAALLHPGRTTPLLSPSIATRAAHDTPSLDRGALAAACVRGAALCGRPMPTARTARRATAPSRTACARCSTTRSPPTSNCARDRRSVRSASRHSTRHAPVTCPALDFAARYSVADGGRTIDFPVGDLLNPVYETLDQLLVAVRAAAAVPARQEPVDRPAAADHEQETKFVVAQPVYEPRIGPAVEANRQTGRSLGGRPGGAALARDPRHQAGLLPLARRAAGGAGARRDARSAAANLAANESLYRNGKITRDLVYRAEADVLEIEQQRIAAASRVRIAQSYVNLLRNQPLAAPLPHADDRRADRRALPQSPDRAHRRAQAGRPIAAGPRDRPSRRNCAASTRRSPAGKAQQDLARAAFKPALAIGAEAGIQGEDYGFGDGPERTCSLR